MPKLDLRRTERSRALRMHCATAFYVRERLCLAEVASIPIDHSMTTKSHAVTDLGSPISFWFAVFSPALGILIGFLAVLIFFH
jgi:hypothetical protein